MIKRKQISPEEALSTYKTASGWRIGSGVLTVPYDEIVIHAGLTVAA